MDKHPLEEAMGLAVELGVGVVAWDGEGEKPKLSPEEVRQTLSPDNLERLELLAEYRVLDDLLEDYPGKLVRLILSGLAGAVDTCEELHGGYGLFGSDPLDQLAKTCVELSKRLTVAIIGAAPDHHNDGQECDGSCGGFHAIELSGPWLEAVQTMVAVLIPIAASARTMRHSDEYKQMFRDAFPDDNHPFSDDSDA